MNNINFRKLAATVKKFRGQRVLVLGDLMMDKYIWGSVSRISPEAPVPVVEVQRDSSCLGGAGNVGYNLEALGAVPLLVGVVGRDDPGRWIRKKAPVRQGIFTDAKRPTTVKTRIIAHHQQVVRVDLEKKRPISPAVEESIIEYIEKENYRGMIISDYSKGLLTESLLRRVLPIAEKKNLTVCVDPKVENFLLFAPVTLITPNHLEAANIVHHECRTDDQVERAGEEILSRARSRYLILKRGEQGMSVFERGKKPVHIPTIAREVFDVTGAGDTVIATAALALLAGSTILEAACLANVAAGIVVGKIGTATATPEELIASLNREAGRRASG
ncbi:MAG TPA: D-glycero-beta-D-manno-heptose-7-phosphate kinase [Candidatus Aminicenantes bacterium]|nr:D-glycero-beta-D-manno-heptose-7-phosphate kinase [Candidatus Aminicenantes bacterium]